MTALLLMAVIAGMVLAIARTSLNLSQAIIKTQGEEMQQQAFFEFLNRRFASLPGNARLELLSQDSGNLYLSDFTLQEVPVSFTWGGQDLLAKAIQISTVQTRSGYLDVVLRYYENEILEGSGSDFDSTAQPEEPYAEIVLLRDVAYFEWRVLDSNTMEWLYDWEEEGRLPLQIELQLAIGAEGEAIRHVFWLPPKQNPEVIMRQMGGSAQPRPDTGTPTIPGGGGTGIGGSGFGGNGVTIDIGNPRQTEGGTR